MAIALALRGVLDTRNFQLNQTPSGTASSEEDISEVTGKKACIRAVFCIFSALDLQTTLTSLAPISLTEIEEAELMNRLDQKYLIHREWVPQLVSVIKDEYHILEVDGARQTEYRNRFIETASKSSLHEHTRGRNIRFKARIRQYGSNLRSFLEVKEKTVHGRTVKARIERDATAGIERPLSPEESKFLSSHYKYEDPELSEVTCHFNRFTLVSNDQTERITIDTDIVFRSGDKEESLGEICIMEIKQERINRNSPLLQALERFKFEYTPLGRRTSMSKYVVGMLLLNPNLPPRTYRSVMKRVRRMRENLH
jgi:hypothetical protein